MLASHAAKDLPTLASHIQQLSSAILSLTTSSIERRSAVVDDTGVLTSCTTAAARSTRILLRGWHHLEKLSRQTEHCRAAECSIVQLFDRLVARLGSTSQSGKIQQEQKSQVARPLTRSASKAFKQSASLGMQHDEATMLLTILSACLASLDNVNEADRRIYQGFLSSIMAAVGRHLFRTTFGHSKGASIEHDIRSISISEPYASPDLHSDHITPSLVQLLDTALALAPLFDRYKPGDKTLQSSQQLLGPIKHRLQTALLEAVFGTNNSDSIAALSSSPVKTAVLPTVEDISADEWFQQEVWRTVGWEILAS